VKARTFRDLDACAAMPVTDVAETEVWIGEGAARANANEHFMPLWRRLYDHALGALHAVQEQADDARPSLDRALAETTDGSRERGMILALYAQVAARQGRTEEAAKWAADAAAHGAASGHPALAHTIGDALSSVWRWRDAIPPLREAALASPRDDRAWMHLAIAYGSDGQSALALDAATRGLALAPRDQDMLRVQALALEALGGGNENGDDAAAAKRAYLEFRSPDDAPRIRSACSKNVPGCALERVPVHVHAMRASPR
jgi:predicted Zn-dependent protease